MQSVRQWFRDLFGVMSDRASSLLILPAAAVLALIDWARLVTLLEWMAFAAIMVGFAVHLSRLALPQVDLKAAMARTSEGPLASAIAAAAVILFMAAIVVALAIWTKP